MIYNFICNKCNKKIELSIPVKEYKSILDCDCGGQLERNPEDYNSVGVIFVGEDWPGKIVKKNNKKLLRQETDEIYKDFQTKFKKSNEYKNQVEEDHAKHLKNTKYAKEAKQYVRKTKKK